MKKATKSRLRFLTRAFTYDDYPRTWVSKTAAPRKDGMVMVKRSVRVEMVMQWRDLEGNWHDVPNVRDEESFMRAHKLAGYKLIKDERWKNKTTKMQSSPKAKGAKSTST